MRRNKIVKCVLCAVMAFVALCGRADVPGPSYSYHAMSYPVWSLDKLTVGHGHVVMWGISSVALFAIWVAVYIRLRRQKRITLAEYLAISVIITSAVLLGLLGEVVMWVISSVALFAIWVFYILFRRQKRIILAEYIVMSVLITSAVLLVVYHYVKGVVAVDSKPGEPYGEYIKRVRKLQRGWRPYLENISGSASVVIPVQEAKQKQQESYIDKFSDNIDKFSDNYN